MSRRPVPQRDLFGAPPPGARDETPVDLYMRELSRGTEKAFHLTPRLGGRDGFAPRALVTRGEGDRASFFTMPKWLAKERGWL